MCQSVQDGGQSLKSTGLRDQYPPDIVKPARLKNDVDSMRSIERKCIDLDKPKTGALRLFIIIIIIIIIIDQAKN